jgi:hypothetical protein
VHGDVLGQRLKVLERVEGLGQQIHSSRRRRIVVAEHDASASRS